MKILFDTNVLLDVLLARQPFLADAAILLKAFENDRLEGFVSASTITDIHYISASSHEK